MFDFQKNQIQKYPKNIDKIVNFSIFRDDNYFLYVFKKAERILAALYMITNYFDVEDPSKLHIRTLGLNFLSLSIKLTEQNSFSKDESVKALTRILFELTSVFEISFLSGMVSEMNHAILRRELDTLLEIVASLENVSRTAESVVLTDPFFAVFDPHTHTATSEKTQEGLETLGLKLKKSQVDLSPPEHNKVPEVPESREYFSKGQDKGHFGTSDKKEIRKNLILSLLKRKDSLTIRDLSQVIHDCSVKTIQRELQGLVDGNVLNKAGERRWTRYFLPKTQHS